MCVSLQLFQQDGCVDDFNVLIIVGDFPSISFSIVLWYNELLRNCGFSNVICHSVCDGEKLNFATVAEVMNSMWIATLIVIRMVRREIQGLGPHLYQDWSWDLCKTKEKKLGMEWRLSNYDGWAGSLQNCSRPYGSTQNY